MLENQGITSGRLYRNKIGSVGAKCLAATMENSTLETLNVSYNQIGTDGAYIILRVLRIRNRTIRTIVLITITGIRGARSVGALISKTPI